MNLKGSITLSVYRGPCSGCGIVIEKLCDACVVRCGLIQRLGYSMTICQTQLEQPRQRMQMIRRAIDTPPLHIKSQPHVKLPPSTFTSPYVHLSISLFTIRYILRRSTFCASAFLFIKCLPSGCYQSLSLQAKKV